MKSQVERTENNSWMKVRSVAAGFLLVMGLPVALALADVGSSPVTEPSYSSSPTTAQAVHIARADVDVGPGSDEAMLAMLPAAH